MCLSALSVLGSQAQGERVGALNLHQNVQWIGGDVRAKFHQDQCKGLDFH